MLAKAVREALDAERQHLQKWRKIADNKIKAIEALLDPDEGLQPELPIVGLTQKAEPEAISGNGFSVAGKGLVEAMDLILASYPSGLPRRDLAEKLESKGFKIGGRMPLRIRLGAEISRRKKNGKLVEKGGRVMLSPVEG